MTIKLSSFANIKTIGGRFKVSFNRLSPHKEEVFYLYLYNKGIRYHTKERYFYENDNREIDGGELLSLIKDWLTLDLEIDFEYKDFINTKDVLNAMYGIKFPTANSVAKRVLTTGSIDYDSNYKHNGVIDRKNNEIESLISALKEKDKIIHEKDLIIKSLRK